ncbi:DUF7674 family protein [Mucilaginibacter gotjawali]|uniref:Uncharacterized protein n=2 Tax=Mucilaginibacter gotjawali TaxID=1550579 RepID=A0A839SKZ7_9SPHI|nr:hypothetical protein [Mucilaginibacter gotjawali]MBB3057914.1 hypothetical protein [Mucilaginibacter gotjawali]BAU52314.1 hypothetical protein MgSA37_00469 [Mucilaginibacter gotjawali]
MTKLKNQKIFISELVDTFPQIKSEVFDEDYKKFISLQIGCFRHFTQNAIDAGDLETVKKCFEFVDINFNAVVFRIENSLMISYLGKLEIARDSEVEKLLPVKLKKAKEELAAYYESLSKDETLNKFLADIKTDLSSS